MPEAQYITRNTPNAKTTRWRSIRTTELKETLYETKEDINLFYYTLNTTGSNLLQLVASIKAAIKLSANLSKDALSLKIKVVTAKQLVSNVKIAIVSWRTELNDFSKIWNSCSRNKFLTEHIAVLKLTKMHKNVRSVSANMIDAIREMKRTTDSLLTEMQKATAAHEAKLLINKQSPMHSVLPPAGAQWKISDMKALLKTEEKNLQNLEKDINEDENDNMLRAPDTEVIASPASFPCGDTETDLLDKMLIKVEGKDGLTDNNNYLAASTCKQAFFALQKSIPVFHSGIQKLQMEVNGIESLLTSFIHEQILPFNPKRILGMHAQIPAIATATLQVHAGQALTILQRIEHCIDEVQGMHARINMPSKTLHTEHEVNLCLQTLKEMATLAMVNATKIKTATNKSDMNTTHTGAIHRFRELLNDEDKFLADLRERADQIKQFATNFVPTRAGGRTSQLQEQPDRRVMINIPNPVEYKIDTHIDHKRINNLLHQLSYYTSYAINQFNVMVSNHKNVSAENVLHLKARAYEQSSEWLSECLFSVQVIETMFKHAELCMNQVKKIFDGICSNNMSWNDSLLLLQVNMCQCIKLIRLGKLEINICDKLLQGQRDPSRAKQIMSEIKALVPILL